MANAGWGDMDGAAQLRFLVDAVPALISYVDTECRYRFVNESYRRWFGRAPAEIEGRHVRDVLGNAAWRGIQSYVERALAGEEVNFEQELSYRDGGPRWVRVTYTPHRNAAGTVCGLVALINDVSARKRAELSLREHQTRLQTLFDNTHDAILLADDDGRYVDANAAACLLLGYTRDELLQKSLADIVPPELQADGNGRWRQFREEGRQSGQIRLVRKDGSIVVADYRAVAGIQPGLNLSSLRDVTASAAAHEALQEADRRKDEFIALLGHELRNPLSAIVNGIEVLNSIGGRDERARHVRGTVERQARHMTRLIDDLLDVTRISRGKIALRRECTDVVQLVRHTVDDYRTLLDESGCNVEWTLPGEPVWVDVDPTRLAQVLGNLLQNAAKFTDAGGRVTLEVSADVGRREASIAVRDTGIGMSAQTLGRLFEPFNQADTSLDRSRGGLGLGLALVRGVVEMHGGRISAHSDGLRRGSEFRIVLPLAEAAAAPTVNKEGAEPFESNRPLRVLVVEDSVPVARIFGMMLEDLGHQPQIATNGAAALEQLPTFRPDVLFSDISMPGMNGYELVREIRAGDRGGHAYLVAMTGFGQPEDRDRALAAGFDEHLVKPAGMDQLRDLLRHVATRNGIPRD